MSSSGSIDAGGIGDRDPELPPHWTVVRSKSHIPGRLYYFNIKNRCSVWGLWETKLEINNRNPTDFERHKGGPVEPSEPPIEPLTSVDTSKNSTDIEINTLKTHEDQQNVIRARVHPWAPSCPFPSLAAPAMFYDPNIWSVPPGNGQFQKQYPHINALATNLPSGGPPQGFSGVNYGAMHNNVSGFSTSSFTPSGSTSNTIVNPPNSLGPAFPGGTTNLVFGAPPTFSVNNAANPFATLHSGHPGSLSRNDPTTLPKFNEPNWTVTTGVTLSKRFVDGKELHLLNGNEVDEEENTEEMLLETEDKQLIRTREKKVSFMDTQLHKKNLDSNDLRLRLAAKKRLRLRSCDELEEIVVRGFIQEPSVVRKRRLSCPVEIETGEGLLSSLEESCVQESDNEQDDGDDDEVVNKGESFGCWLLKEAKPGVNTDICYIAVDTNIFIHRLQLIERLIESDTDGVCRILVPWRVNDEVGNLRKLKKTPALRIRSNKANALIEQYSRNPKVMVVQSPIENAKKLIDISGNDDEIVNCCIQYAEKGMHVILVSDDKNLNIKVLSCGIETYTCDEMNGFMDKVSKIVKERQRLLRVKVTITNPLSRQEDKQNTFNTNENDMVHSVNQYFGAVDLQNSHPVLSAVPMQRQKVIPQFRDSSSGNFTAAFNPIVPPPTYQPNYCNTGAFTNTAVSNSLAPSSLETFAANIMSTLNSQNRTDNTSNIEYIYDTSPKSSSTNQTKNSSKNLKKLTVPVSGNYNNVASNMQKTNEKPTESRPGFNANVISHGNSMAVKNPENPYLARKKIKLVRNSPLNITEKNNRIRLQRSWNKTLANQAKNLKEPSVQTFPKVPTKNDVSSVSISPATDPETTLIVNSTSMSSNYATSTVNSKCVPANTVNIHPNNLTVCSNSQIHNKKANPLLKTDKWVSKRTQRMVEDSQIEDTPRERQETQYTQMHTSDCKTPMSPRKNVTKILTNEKETSKTSGEYVITEYMEKKLSRRMDQFTCMLLQTMEETLSSELQQMNKLHALSPPWTLHEAASILMNQYRFEHKAISERAGKLALTVSEVTHDYTTEDGIKLEKVLPSTPEKFMGLYKDCRALITSLKCIKADLSELEEYEKRMSDLVEEITNGEKDIFFDELDSSNCDDKYNVDHPNNEKGEFVIDNREDVDVNGKVVSFLKKHYAAWSNYDKINIGANKNSKHEKDLIKSQRVIPAAQDISIALASVGNVTEAVTRGTEKKDAYISNIPQTNTKENHNLQTSGQEVTEQQPKIIRNLKFIPEFEKIFEMKYSQEGDDMDDYYENEDFDHHCEEDYEVDQGNKCVDNIYGDDKHLHTENMQVGNCEKVHVASKMQQNNCDTNGKVTDTRKNENQKINHENEKEDPEIVEENNNGTENQIILNGKGKKLTNTELVAYAIRSSFLNSLAYSVELCGELDKAEMPVLLEGESQGLPELKDMVAEIRTIVTCLQEQVALQSCDAAALRASLSRLSPRRPLPPASDMPAALLALEKVHVLSAAKHLCNVQAVFAVLCKWPKERLRPRQ